LKGFFVFFRQISGTFRELLFLKTNPIMTFKILLLSLRSTAAVDISVIRCYNITIKGTRLGSTFLRYSNFRNYLNFIMTASGIRSLDLGDYYLSWKEVIAFTKTSEATIRRSIKSGIFPPPIKTFKRTVRFRKSDILLWAEGLWRSDK